MYQVMNKVKCRQLCACIEYMGDSSPTKHDFTY